MNKKKFTKLLALYLPYLVIGLAATNLGEAWRLAEGKELGDKIVSLMGTLPAAFANPLPSLHPLDILVGMAASAMESKRLGLCQKSLFVVPNHLTEQWASEFLRLYPNAKLLVTSKKDFEPANRKRFCARIATGDYDAVIIGHSQFEKIPLSAERQARIIEDQIEEIEKAIAEAKEQSGEHFTVKQMEKTRKTLEVKLKKLQSTDRKDDVVTFEQLGVDRLFVDESQNYKNRAKRCA